MFYTKLSVASLLNNRRQYTSLFLVCLIGVAIMLSVVTVTDGMLVAVRQKAKQYYAGDVQFLGGNRALAIYNGDEVMADIASVLDVPVDLYGRFEYDAHNSALYYEGVKVRQRIFKGVDFDNERALLSSFTFLEGGIPESGQANVILLSSPIASKLSVHAGDMITMQVNTIYGYTNTLSLVVGGIFLDSSLFGMYTSYLDIQTMWNATGYPRGYLNRIGLYFKSGSPSKEMLEHVEECLSQKFNMYPMTDDKNIFYNVLYSASDQSMPLYSLVPLDANIKDLEILIDALRIVVALIVVILVAIISVGIASTYRVIVMRRITEVGIYRALGMKKRGVVALFLTETTVLLVAGYLAGILLCALITGVLSFFDFSFIPAFDIFLMNSHLVPSIDVPKLALLLLVITVTTLVSLLFTIRNAVHITPVGALATTA